MKAEHLRHSGLIQRFPILERKLEQITIGFVSGLPHTSRGSDDIFVIMDRLTNSVYFIPI